MNYINRIGRFNACFFQKTSGKRKKQAEKTSGNGKTADNKQAIIEFITQKGIARTAEIADAVGLSQPRVRVLLAELVAEGIVEPQGEGRARAYTAKE